MHFYPLAMTTLLLLAACHVGNASEEPNMESTHPPGAAPYASELAHQLAAALAAKGDDYVPRTHHLRTDGGPRFTNRLILEDSPYLLQHAHNPVDWYPWGPEAFARAEAEDKPIFLSIGYSTCHWCHVMERESFEDEDIARLLNEHFVSIKIDRERRPDIDEIYMTAVQLLTQRGGWPMSSFLMADGKPFFGGTYFPPDRFTLLLQRIIGGWEANRGEIASSAERIAEAVRQATAARGEARNLGNEIFEQAVEALQQRHDKVLGGFGRAPKFPHEPELLFLLSRGLRHGDGAALKMATHSLDAMARGGIYDQVGGGFHRYSVDAQWLVPHFEKMLYNQAHLSRAYLEAHRLTGNPFFARVARQTLDYVLHEMTAPGGGFYSATDADSEGEEGRFFVWTPTQLRQVLSPEDAELAIDLWSVREGGNFEGHSILFLDRPLAAVAEARGESLEPFLQRVDRIRGLLWRQREGREHPLRDDKILAAWNGMMITALSHGAAILEEPRYLAGAEKAAAFLWQHNLQEDGSLWRVHLDGNSSVDGLQEDYAYLAEGFVALYDVNRDATWLGQARRLADTMNERFWDADGGGFFMGPAVTDPPLISRPKSPNDGAIPSGNSVAVRLLAQLSNRLEDPAYGERAAATAAAFSAQLRRAPQGYAYMLTGLDEQLHGAAGPLGYGAQGHLRAEGRIQRHRDGGLEIVLDLHLDDGWHINARQPRQEHFVGTDLRLGEAAGQWRLGPVEAPLPMDLTVDFEEQPMSVYSGDSRWTAPLEAIDDGLEETSASPALWLPVELSLQACDASRCLKPEVLILELPPAP